MQYELFGPLYQYFVLDFLIKFRTERHGRQRLRFAAGENRRAVGGGQVAHFAPDGADFVRAAAVQALALVENHVAHGLLLHVVVEVLVNQRGFLHQFLLGVARGEFGLQRIEHVAALVLHRAARSDGVGLVVEFADDSLAQFFVVDFVAVGAFHILAQFLGQFDLDGAVFLDLFVGELDGSEHHFLRNLLHLALDHQNVVDRTADHDVQVAFGHLRESGVDGVLAVLAYDAHFRNRAAERNVRHGQCGRCGQSGQRIGLNILVRRNQVHRDVNFGVVVRGEQRAQGTVDQTCREHLRVVGLAFAFHEAARIAAARGVFLLVFDLQGHEVGVGFGVFGRYDSTQQHRVAHLDDYRAVGLLGQLARFDLDLASVGQRDDLADCIVQLLFFHKIF